MNQPLYTRRNSFRYSSDSELDRPQSRKGRCEETNLLSLLEIRPPPLASFGRSARIIVTVLTELQQKGKPVHSPEKLKDS
jgi:hypothetical protein